ncbi:MAG: hypothetical protein HY769_08770 [Candidatus Stahlbacteria bacterium]|nr:hypothetical protein [Candidatus Stahlbacteria bacterium]
MKQIGIVDYIEVLIRKKRLIFWNTIIITGLAIIISFILPKKYTSCASLLPPLSGTEVLGSGIMEALTDISALRSGLGISTPSDLFAKILESEKIMDGVIKECNLMSIYKAKTKTNAYRTLTAATDIAVTPEGIISIATTAKFPNLAKQITESYIKNLDEVNKDLVMSIGKRNRIFLDKRLEQVKETLKLAEESLREFQESHKTISIEEEIAPILHTAADLKAQILAYEVQLGILSQYATDENPEVIKVKSQVEELDKKLRAIEYKTDSTHFGIGFSIPFKNVPTVTLKLVRLKREIIVQEKVIALLTEQYEKAKIQEVKDTPTINVLQEPRIPDLRSFPRRRPIIMGAFILSFTLSILMAFLLNWSENLTTEENEKLRKIIALLKRR